MVCQALYNQLPQYEPISPIPWGTEQPKNLVHKVQSQLGSPGFQECGPELPGPSCPQIMPCLEAVALILLIMLVPDPPRGAAEKQGVATTGDPRSSWCEDVRYLWRK